MKTRIIAEAKRIRQLDPQRSFRYVSNAVAYNLQVPREDVWDVLDQVWEELK